MSLTPDQAADSLREIERTRRRSASARGYANSSPFLVMWGVIWMIGYTISDFAPHYSGWVWLALTVAGFLGSMAIGRARARQGNPHPGINKYAGMRFLGTFVAIAALTLGGFFFLPAHFLLWMAVVGGGALVLAGLWLRTV
jgi:hypothetical protein